MFIDDSHVTKSLFSDICTRCKHFNLKSAQTDKKICAAFLSGIPSEIWTGKNNHTKPYKGDRGIRFEKRDSISSSL